MSALVHAIVVARATSAPAEATERLARTLEAVRAQSRPVDGLTVVACGRIADLDDVVADAGVGSVITAPEKTGFAAAVRLALARVPADRGVWLLTQDTDPEPAALAGLAGALERGPSVAIAAPKLVDADAPSLIVSLGLSMTPLGRTVPLANGEYDQGQHDTDDDVLGADIRGILIRHDSRPVLGPDPALHGADEGLDLGVRARLAGRRVALAPAARIAVRAGGEGDLPLSPMRRAYAIRTAQLHRRLAYAPAWALPLHWLALLPLALWRTLVDLVAKRPTRVPVEWAAAVTVMVRLAAIARSRREIRRGRTGGWERIRPLRATRAQLRERYDDGGPETRRQEELAFFSGGGAWVVLGAAAVSVAAFFSLLAWPSLGGGALLPLRDTVTGLWRDALYGLRPTGLAEVSAADPFSTLVAVLGSLWPVGTSYTVVILWLLALPLAVLGGWFAATRVSDRSGVRAVAGIAYALAPSFLAALVEGRPAAVLAHLLLPWLFYVAAVVHRSWGAAGAASVLLLAVLAAAPSLAPAFAVAWLVALVLTIAFRARHGVTRMVWVVVPSLVWFAPLVLAHARRGTLWAALADPGVPLGTDGAVPGWMLAAGFPAADPGGWISFLGGVDGTLLGGETFLTPSGVALAAVLLAAPMAILALLAPLTPRWRAGAGLLVAALLGIGTALGAVGVQVSYTQGEPVGIWPGAGLSLAWLAVVAAAAVTLDAARMPSTVRALSGVLAAVCVAVIAVPALTAVVRADAAIGNGPASTLPAYVGAEAAGQPSVGTLVLTPRPDGGLATEVVWGESATLGGQSTLQRTQTHVSEDDRVIAALAADLVSSSGAEVTGRLGELGLRYVLLSSASGHEPDAGRMLRLQAVTAIDQRDGFARIGETAAGVLWRLDDEPAPRPGLSAAQRATATTVTLAQGAALLAALLLAVPTRETRRAARTLPRIVGGGYEEER